MTQPEAACCVCGVAVHTSLPPFGSQLADGRWVCGTVCYASATSPKWEDQVTNDKIKIDNLRAARDAAIARAEKAEGELAAVKERVDLDIDEFRRIKAELTDLRVGRPPLTDDSARSLCGVVAGICERAITAGRQRVPLIEQRDKAERERDAATSEVAKQRMRADSLLAALESLRDRCGQQRADWLKESRGASDKMLRASCAMAAGSFGTVLEWAEEAIASGGAS